MDISRRFKSKKREILNYLLVHVLKDLDGDVVVFLVDRTDDSFDSSFNGFNTWLQRTRLVLCLGVNEGKAKHCFHSSSLHEFQILQPLFLLLGLQRNSKRATCIISQQTKNIFTFQSILILNVKFPKNNSTMSDLNYRFFSRFLCYWHLVRSTSKMGITQTIQYNLKKTKKFNRIASKPQILKSQKLKIEDL